jgi:hypothetical protein
MHAATQIVHRSIGTPYACVGLSISTSVENWFATATPSAPFQPYTSRLDTTTRSHPATGPAWFRPLNRVASAAAPTTGSTATSIGSNRRSSRSSSIPLCQLIDASSAWKNQW